MKNFKKVISVSLASIFFSYSSFASDATTKSIIFKSNNKATGYKDLENNVQNIFDQVQIIRDLKTKKPVTVGIKDTKELNSFLIKTFKEDYPDVDMKKDYLSLLHFGLIKKGTDLKKTFLNLYTEQIAGFYDNKTRELYVIDNPKITSLESSIVISHELTHALQDQYFDLTKFIKSATTQDKSLARLSLIEGEAMLSSVEYMSKSLVSGGLESLRAIGELLKNPIGGSFSSDALSQTPGFLVEQMIFPYTEGMKFTSYIKENSGDWAGLNQVYNKPPLSTEQIMHPEKYIADEKPVEIKIDEKLLKDKNYSFIKKDTLGEFFLLNYFLEYLGEDESKQASSGWGGDTSILFSDKKDNTLMIYTSVWDTPKDAKEFFDSYKSALRSRYRSRINVNKENNFSFSAKTDTGLVYLTIKDKAVNIAEGFNDKNKITILKYLDN